MMRLGEHSAASSLSGVRLMVGAGALIALASLLAKALGIAAPDQPALHPFQVSAGRFVFALVALSAFLLLFARMRPGFQGTDWKRHLSRSVCGWLGVTAMFAAVARMPVAEATAISFLSPLVTMGLAILFLGEYLKLKKVIAIVLALAGAALILKPGTDAVQTAGLFALAAAGLMGLEAILVKRLGDTEPALRILLINNAIGSIVSVSVASVFWIWPSAHQWLLLVALGAIMVCGQSLFIQSLKRGEASLVIPAFYSVLVFATLYDFAFYGAIPHWTGLLGAGLIVAGAFFLTRSNSTPKS